MSLSVTQPTSQHVVLPSHLAAHTVFRIGESGMGTRGMASDTLKSGFATLDRELAGGGWPSGDLAEILCDGSGMGELSLLLPAMARANAPSVWIAPPHLPYAPALAASGLDLSRLFICEASRAEDALWAAEQALASGATATVCVWVSSVIGNTPLRRLKHAAASGGATCWLMRPTVFAQHASPATLRIALNVTADGQLSVNLLKRRGLPPNRRIQLVSRLLPCLAPHRRRAVTPAPTKPEVPSTPLREWLGRTFGPSAISQASVRTRAMSPDR
jgi:cell division inhibitor SulA/protein ImuA